MKRKISLYLAVIMVFNLVLPFSTPMRVSVEAATSVLSVDMAEGLTPGLLNHVPIRINNPAAQAVGRELTPNHAYMNFPVTSSVPGNSYVLSYVDRSGRTITLTIQRNFDYVRVVYDIAFPGPVPTSHGFQVHAGPSSPNPRFLPITEYLNLTTRPMRDADNLTGDMVYGDPTDPTTHVPPTFYIGLGGGFSFRYHGEEVHLWFGSDGTFHFAAGSASPPEDSNNVGGNDGFLPGHVYEVTLSYADNEICRQLIITGVGSRDPRTGFGRVDVTPFANAGQQSSATRGEDRFNTRRAVDVIYHSRHDDDGFVAEGEQSVGNVYAGLPNQAVNEYPRLPAVEIEPLGFIIGFDVPSHSAIDINHLTDVRAQLQLAGSGHSFVVDIFDMFGVSGDPVVAIPGAAENIDLRGNPEIIRVDGLVSRIEFTLLVFDDRDGEIYLPSVLFNDPSSSITILPRADEPGLPNINSRGTPVSNAYTLLHFGVIIINGVYHVDIIVPYGVRGEYVIVESSSHTFPAIGAPPVINMAQRTGMVDPALGITPIPVHAEAVNFGRYFQVFFKPNVPFDDEEIRMLLGGNHNLDGIVQSQVLFYRGNVDDISLRTPQYFSVTLHHHIPRPGDMLRQTGIAEFTARWDIAQTELLESLFERLSVGNELVIYYDLNWNMEPYYYPEGLFAQVRITLTQGADGEMMVDYTLVHPDTGAHTMVIDGIELLWDGPQPLRNDVAPINPHPMFGYMAAARFRVDTFHDLYTGIDGFAEPTVGLRFPWIHFMNVRAARIGDRVLGGGAAGGTIQVPSSPYDSFTLSDFDRHEVPPPQHISIHTEQTYAVVVGDSHDQVSVDVTWTIPSMLIRNYLVHSYGLLNPDGEYNADDVSFEFWMNLYMTQYEDNMGEDEGFWRTNLLYPEYRLDARTHRTQPSAPINTDILPVITGQPEHENNIMYFSAINGNAANVHVGGSPARETLRSNDNIVAVVRLELEGGVRQNFIDNTTPIQVTYRIDGLDKNQRYYVYVDFSLHQRGTGVDVHGEPLVVDTIETSFLSSLVGTITPGDPDVPDGLDVDPPAPDLRVEDDSITLNSVILNWDRITGLPVPRNHRQSIEYEIIRIRDTQMEAGHLNNRVPFPQVWQNLSDSHEEMIGLTTTSSGTALQALNGIPVAPNLALIDILTDEDDDPIRLRDGSLVSNSLYFYYVRTVRTVYGPDGTIRARAYSVWSHVSVTTDIAGAPRNLRVETQREFDPQTEVKISFEAPINHAALAGVLGTQIRLQYQLRIDEGDWMDPVVMQTPFLMQHARPVPGDDAEHWTWFLYHITGLEAGQRYFVRVRMVEFDGNVAISHSLWSNEGTWITDSCPEEEYYRQREEDWRQHLRRELERLLRNPYWVIRQDASAYQVIFRTQMFNDVMARAVGGQIHLPFVNARQSTYYLPMYLFSQAWEAELAFILTNDEGNMQLMIPARSINLNENDQIMDVERTIRQRDFEDYMVRLNVNWSTPNHIQGEETLTSVADIRFDLVSTRTNIVRWERELADSLINRIDEIATDPRNVEDIRNAVRDGSAPEDIARDVNHIVENVARAALARVVSDNMRELTSRSRTVAVPRLDRNMTVSARTGPALSAVEAYQSVSGNLWNNVPTMDVGDGQGIFTTQLGPVVFTGRIINIQGIEQVVGGPVAQGVVARHGLDDFFGRGNFNVNQFATRGMLVNSVARMMGAPRGTDAIPWLRSQNVDVSAAGMNNPITYQSALHLIMLVYEAQTGTRADSLQIRDFNMLNRLTCLDPQYRSTVQAAIQLNLVDGNTLVPSAQITIGSLLEVLALLDRLVGL
ncbi:MAG: hypothetical protein FWC91_07225 [Defluviitaleaceae bacterium]|nr:hypothetical protein [Defluviitaleaceae bacterium]